MIWEMIGGIFFILLSIVITVFAIDHHRSNVGSGYIPHVGVIAVSDVHKGQIIVDYTIDGKSYSTPFDCKIYARVGEMPPVGLKVKVIAEPDAPEEIYVKFFRQYGRGNSGGHNYVNYDPKKNVRKVIYLVLICFSFGIYYLFQALGLPVWT